MTSSMNDHKIIIHKSKKPLKDSSQMIPHQILTLDYIVPW